MPSPQAVVVATVAAVTFGLFYLLYKALTDDSTPMQQQRRRGCSACGLEGGHINTCPLRPHRATEYRVYITDDAGVEECRICLNKIERGNLVARLPCFCIYHKKCIDRWFQEKATCPIHRS